MFMLIFQARSFKKDVPKAAVPIFNNSVSTFICYIETVGKMYEFSSEHR